MTGSKWLITFVGVAALLTACDQTSVATTPAGVSLATASPPSVGPIPTPTATPEPARSASGIPLELDGQPVYVGLAGAVRAARSADDTPFLVGGWFQDGFMKQCEAIGPWPRLLSQCGSQIGADGWTSFTGPQGRFFWPGAQGIVEGVVGSGLRLPNDVGPAIVRVHTHDAQAASCPEESNLRPRCQQVMVVDAVLWTGDEWTDASPLTVMNAATLVAGQGIRERITLHDKSILTVDRRVAITPPAAPCPWPWPHQTYVIREDPRFGALLVFPTEAARIAAQPALAGGDLSCVVDPRVVRPGPPRWLAFENLLLLVFDEAAADALTASLTGKAKPLDSIPFPPASLDEAYRVVDDAEARRAMGDFGGDAILYGERSADDWYSHFQEDTYRRLEANALTYVIGPKRRIAVADIPPGDWAWIRTSAVASSLRLFVVDHPDSTDPALAREYVVAYRWRADLGGAWDVIAVSPPTS
jgi:hypothetical protein